MQYLELKSFAVGYNGRALISGIDLGLERGKVLTLIGPNGAGKSTILKSITRQLTPVAGDAFLQEKSLRQWGGKEFARTAAVLLTDRVRPELMTCADVVGMGRYPYTDMFGRLTREDRRIVEESLAKVHASELDDQDFTTLSDGQRQRIMLARAICQQPEIIILDEPTAFLDIRHKIELLEILRAMAREENITVIMSLHEIDLAMKASDLMLCVKGDTIAAFGTPEEILQRTPIEALYGMEKGSFDIRFGSVELQKPEGTPRVFVIAGNGCGIPVFRRLQRQNIPFAAGILFENDIDCSIARQLSDHVIVSPAFTPISDAVYRQAEALMLSCERVIDAGTAVGELNRRNGDLLALARRRGLLQTGAADEDEIGLSMTVSS